MAKFFNKAKHITSFVSHPNHPRPSNSLSTFRLSTFGLLLTFNFAFLISACGLDIEDPTPPSPPVWVQKSLPEEWPERGIDAHETNGIYLEWMPNPQNENIAKYLVFRAEYFEVVDSLDNFIQIEIIDQQVPEITEYIDHLAVFGIRYYYKLKAEDRSGNVSSFSDSLTYKLLTSISGSAMLPNNQDGMLNSERRLSWAYFYTISMENYCLTILDNDGLLMSREIINPKNYTGEEESWNVPDSIIFNSGAIYRWRVDMNAKYTEQRETAGSESPWALFIY